LGAYNKSLDASGGSASRNLLGAAEGGLMRAAASTPPFGVLQNSMYKTLTIICFSLAILAAPSVTPAQKITSQEEHEAHDLADRFIRRLRETRDLRPLRTEFFLSDLKSSGLTDPFWGRSVNLNAPAGANLSDLELWDFYAAKFTVDYLSMLNLASKISLDSLDKLKPEELDRYTPQSIAEYSKTIKIPEREPPPRDLAMWIYSIKTHTVSLLQEELAKHPPEETEFFKNNLASFARHLNEPKNPWGKPSVANLTRPDMRLITMEIPFHVGLILIRENGQLKIWFAATFIPPD